MWRIIQNGGRTRWRTRYQQPASKERKQLWPDTLHTLKDNILCGLGNDGGKKHQAAFANSDSVQ